MEWDDEDGTLWARRQGRGQVLTSGSHAGGSRQRRHRPAEVHTVSPAPSAFTLTVTNQPKFEPKGFFFFLKPISKCCDNTTNISEDNLSAEFSPGFYNNGTLVITADLNWTSSSQLTFKVSLINYCYIYLLMVLLLLDTALSCVLLLQQQHQFPLWGINKVSFYSILLF